MTGPNPNFCYSWCLIQVLLSMSNGTKAVFTSLVTKHRATSRFQWKPGTWRKKTDAWRLVWLADWLSYDNNVLTSPSNSLLTSLLWPTSNTSKQWLAPRVFSTDKPCLHSPSTQSHDVGQPALQWHRWWLSHNVPDHIGCCVMLQLVWI